MNELMSIPVHRSLHRPDFLMGMDTKLFGVVVMIVCILTFILQTWYSAVVGVSVFLISVPLLRMMAAKDPKMREVYMAYIRYQRFYPARSTPFALCSNKGMR